MSYEIPTSSENSRFSQKTELDGVPYTFYFRWNWRMQRWILDINDDGDLPIVNGVVLNITTDILASYRIAGNGLPQGLLYLFNTKSSLVECGRYDLGVNCVLLYEEA